MSSFCAFVRTHRILAYALAWAPLPRGFAGNSDFGTVGHLAGTQVENLSLL